MPRKCALEALERFRKDNAWSGQVLSSIIKNNHLNNLDSSFATRLFFGVLQNLYLLDYYIDYYSSSKPEPKVRDILRIGIYQLLFMDKVPSSAAVNETVNLCKNGKLSRASGFVNAVLRKVSSKELPHLKADSEAERLSILYSHPLWLVNEWIDQFGLKECEEILRKNNIVSPIYIQVNTLKTDASTLQKHLVCVKNPMLEDCFQIEKNGEISQLEAFKKGWFYVQDPAAKMSVDALELHPGMKILDACAAPGGKSFAAAIKTNDKADILSCDINSAKLDLVRTGAIRLGLHSIKTRTADATEFNDGFYDVVIADVPCSGLGVIRKKPDIRYRKKEELDKLPEIQKAILQNLSCLVKEGGVLCYCTCTTRKTENEDVCREFCNTNPSFYVEGEKLFRPDIDDTDGFYTCRMRRKK